MEASGPHARPPARRRSGLVVPHTLRWYERVGAALGCALVRVAAATIRFQWDFDPRVLEQPNQPKVFCTWHNRLALCLFVYRKYAQLSGCRPRLAALVSASHDGAILARVLELFGVQPIRGSSSRRGAQAMLELTTWAERGYDLAITPDGPRGPRYVMQPGPIALAQVTRLPVVLSAYRVSWKITLKSWDAFQIPLPFARVEVKATEPITIPENLDDEGRERWRQELERRLREITFD